MRTILILVFLIFTGRCFSQVRETTVSDTSVVIISVINGDSSFSLKTKYRQGEWIVYFDSLHQRKACHFKYSQYNYISTEWYGNGQKKIEYPSPSIHAGCFDMNEWYRDGKVKAKCVCYEDSCVEIDYYPSGQIKEKNINTPDSSHHAFVWHYTTEFYENGQAKYDVCDPNGKRQTIAHYYSSGKKSSLVDIWDHQYLGPYQEWYENGKLKVEGEYYVPTEHKQFGSSIKTGKWTYYDETGKKIKEEFYEENKLVKTLPY